MDSLKYAKILEDAGLPRSQAETHVRIISEITSGGDMVTKSEMNALKANMESRLDALDVKIDRVEERLNLKLDHMQTQLIVKLGAFMTVLFGSAVGAASLILA